MVACRASSTGDRDNIHTADDSRSSRVLLLRRRRQPLQRLPRPIRHADKLRDIRLRAPPLRDRRRGERRLHGQRLRESRLHEHRLRERLLAQRHQSKLPSLGWRLRPEKGWYDMTWRLLLWLLYRLRVITS